MATPTARALRDPRRHFVMPPASGKSLRVSSPPSCLFLLTLNHQLSTIDQSGFQPCRQLAMIEAQDSAHSGRVRRWIGF